MWFGNDSSDSTTTNKGTHNQKRDRAANILWSVEFNTKSYVLLRV